VRARERQGCLDFSSRVAREALSSIVPEERTAESATRFGNFDSRTAKLLTGAFFVAMLIVSGLLYLDLESGSGVPSEANPSCSWMTAPPPNDKTVCRLIYDALQSIARAEFIGDAATIRGRVTNSAVADRIISQSRELRKQHAQFLHIAPSFTLGPMSDGTYEAIVGLVGRSSTGKISAPQQVYLRLRHGKAVIVNDRPNEEW
jgi:hypothetical protein